MDQQEKQFKAVLEDGEFSDEVIFFSTFPFNSLLVITVF